MPYALLYIHSEPMHKICSTYGSSPYTYNEAHALDPNYTIHLHKKLISHRLITKHHDGYINYGGRRCHVNYYAATPKLTNWYHLNFVSMKGQGKLAKMEREKLKVII